MAVGMPLRYTNGPFALTLPINEPLVVIAVALIRLVVQSALKPVGAVYANGRWPKLQVIVVVVPPPVPLTAGTNVPDNPVNCAFAPVAGLPEST